MGTTTISCFLKAFAFLVLVFAIASMGVATNITVPGDHATIEAAIAAAAPGDTVSVAAGTYTPAGGRLIINKSITVQAEPGSVTRPLILTNCASWTSCAIQIAADNVVFDGFEVDNSAAKANTLGFYIVGDYGGAKNGWTIRNCDIHNGRNCIRPIGNNVTIEYNNLHETESDLINAEYGACYGLTVRYNWLHSHHSDLGGKPAGITYSCSTTAPPDSDVEISYNYCWATRTFVDFQNFGGLSPANTIVVAHNTVDYWIGDLPTPVVGTENAQQMSVAWWAGSGNWNAPRFVIRDNLFTRQKWYAIVDTDSFLLGQVLLQRNMYWQWYLNDSWYPGYAYPNEWPGPRGAVGWDNMGTGNEFVDLNGLTGDPLYAATGVTPDEYYALRAGSPAYFAATDGTNIGAWQGLPPDSEGPSTFDVLATPNPVAVNTAVTLTATIDDAATGNSAIGAAEYSLDGGLTWCAMTAVDGAFDAPAENVSATLAPFTDAAVCLLLVRGTDVPGNVGAPESQLLAVYDPSAGFVTGGGWINSPSGAYVPAPELTGKATFAFVAKYQKGASIPTGQAEFRFHIADMSFKSASYDWMVVAGARAQFKGDGKINGAGLYRFMLTAVDGDLLGGNHPDQFRIKIWDKATGDIVYDNQFGDLDTSELSTAIAGGSIVIHK